MFQSQSSGISGITDLDESLRERYDGIGLIS